MLLQLAAYAARLAPNEGFNVSACSRLFTLAFGFADHTPAVTHAETCSVATANSFLAPLGT